jgi:hypothetical protein
MERNQSPNVIYGKCYEVVAENEVGQFDFFRVPFHKLAWALQPIVEWTLAVLEGSRRFLVSRRCWSFLGCIAPGFPPSVQTRHGTGCEDNVQFMVHACFHEVGVEDGREQMGRDDPKKFLRLPRNEWPKEGNEQPETRE